MNKLDQVLKEVFPSRLEALNKYGDDVLKVAVEAEPFVADIENAFAPPVLGYFQEVNVYLREFSLRERNCWKYCLQATGHPNPEDFNIVNDYFKELAQLIPKQNHFPLPKSSRIGK